MAGNVRDRPYRAHYGGPFSDCRSRIGNHSLRQGLDCIETVVHVVPRCKGRGIYSSIGFIGHIGLRLIFGFVS